MRAPWHKGSGEAERRSDTDTVPVEVKKTGFGTALGKKGA
jgi:hypothetical protein